MTMWYVFSEQPCRKTEDITLLLELSCLHILSSSFDFLYKYHMVCVPTTNNLNRAFLLEYYPFFNILKLLLRKAVRVISTPGIHTGISTSMPICHDIIISILCSKTFWLVSWLFYGPSTHFRSFRARSVSLSTLFLGKSHRQFTSTYGKPSNSSNRNR